MIKFLKSILVLFPLASFVPQSAMAEDQDFLWHAKDSEMAPMTWSGFIFNPQITYSTLDLNGAGSKLLNSPKGIKAGLELGYDWQLDNFVVGLAGDASYTWMEGGNSAAGADNYNSRQPFMGSLRARVGTNFDRFMVYGTGGLALSRLEIKNLSTGFSDGKTMVGWVAGGGVEYAWNKKITARLEYLHSDFGSADFATLPVADSQLSSSTNAVNFSIISRF